MEELVCSDVLWTDLASNPLHPSSVILWKLQGMDGGGCDSGAWANVVKEQAGERSYAMARCLLMLPVKAILAGHTEPAEKAVNVFC